MPGTTLGKQKKPFGQWLRTRKVQQWLVIIAFMTIPLILLVTFSYVPFAKMFEFSLYKMKRYDSKNNKFIGLENYLDVFSRDDCFNSLKLAGYYIVASFIQLAMALYFATILCFKVRGGSLFKGLIFFPYLISGIAIGFIFKFFYTRGFVFDTVLSWIGLNPESLPYWLKDTRINNASLAATSVWRYMGQNMVLFLGAMMSVDPTLYEACAIDGANSWAKFRYIMLPSIKSVILLNMILSISGSLSAFEPPYVITGGTFGTSTYFVMMNSLAHEKGKIGLAAAMAVVLMGLIFIVTIAQQVIMKVADEDWREERRNKKLAKARKKAEKEARA
ncbi:MAG: sugar ABC transporter permease [Lachnospiraceae bacterium]|nr:sugar ABC transporter permease [Lachnospiraceae bacterium]